MIHRIPEELEQKIISHAMQDLDPPAALVHTKLALATAVGGLLSMLVCGQFGIGLTPFSQDLAHTLHGQLGPVYCSMLCGVMFTVFPLALLRFVLSHPIQFKVIMKRRRALVAAWFAGFGGAMAYLGHHGNDLLSFVAWVFAALLASQVIFRLYNMILPKWNPTALLDVTKLVTGGRIAG